MEKNRQPLAEKMRPRTLGDIVGQRHLVGKNGVLAKIIETKMPTSLILWGAPGTGKTTLARIIASELEADFVELSAVISGKKDVEGVIVRARQNWNLGMRTVLFVDEIHRFNKAQQDAFLPHVELGLITLIGATTENPSFEIISPLLSRMRVLRLEPLMQADVETIVRRAVKMLGRQADVSRAVVSQIAQLSGGDGRLALGNLELVLGLYQGKITREDVSQAVQKKSPRYDKKGDKHYDIISAFIKSMRGSDVTATLYYLSRMLDAGEDAKFIARRMIIFASEDIGLAGNGALALAVATFQAVERVGLPEAKYNLYHCAVALAKSPKSREITEAMHHAQALAKKFPDSEVPLHIRNAPTKLMKDLGYGEGYEWQANFQPENGFLPPDVKIE